MGTNYYAVKRNSLSYEKPIHIGKLSAGWKFAFQDSEYFHSFTEFQNFLRNHVNILEYKIVDEYGEKHSSKEILELIKSHQNEKSNNSNDNERAVNGYRFINIEFF